MYENFPTEIFLFNKLSGHAPLVAMVDDRIYPTLAPEESEYPHVIYAFQSGTTTYAIGREQLTSRDIRIFTRPLFLVRGITEDTTNEDAAKLASRIDDALTGASGQVEWDGLTYEISSCYCEEAVQWAEEEEGVRTNHLGGLYRMFVQPQR